MTDPLGRSPLSTPISDSLSRRDSSLSSNVSTDQNEPGLFHENQASSQARPSSPQTHLFGAPLTPEQQGLVDRINRNSKRQSIILNEEESALLRSISPQRDERSRPPSPQTHLFGAPLTPEQQGLVDRINRNSKRQSIMLNKEESGVLRSMSPQSKLLEFNSNDSLPGMERSTPKLQTNVLGMGGINFLMWKP